MRNNWFSKKLRNFFYYFFKLSVYFITLMSLFFFLLFMYRKTFMKYLILSVIKNLVYNALVLIKFYITKLIKVYIMAILVTCVLIFLFGIKNSSDLLLEQKKRNLCSVFDFRTGRVFNKKFLQKTLTNDDSFFFFPFLNLLLRILLISMPLIAITTFLKFVKHGWKVYRYKKTKNCQFLQLCEKITD